MFPRLQVTIAREYERNHQLLRVGDVVELPRDEAIALIGANFAVPGAVEFVRDPRPVRGGFL